MGWKLLKKILKPDNHLKNPQISVKLTKRYENNVKIITLVSINILEV